MMGTEVVAVPSRDWDKTPDTGPCSPVLTDTVSVTLAPSLALLVAGERATTAESLSTRYKLVGVMLAAGELVEKTRDPALVDAPAPVTNALSGNVTLIVAEFARANEAGLTITPSTAAIEASAT